MYSWNFPPLQYGPLGLRQSYHCLHLVLETLHIKSSTCNVKVVSCIELCKDIWCQSVIPHRLEMTRVSLFYIFVYIIATEPKHVIFMDPSTKVFQPIRYVQSTTANILNRDISSLNRLSCLSRPQNPPCYPPSKAETDYKKKQGPLHPTHNIQSRSKVHKQWQTSFCCQMTYLRSTSAQIYSTAKYSPSMYAMLCELLHGLLQGSVGVSRHFSAAEVDVRQSGRLQKVVGSIGYQMVHRE